MGWFWILYIGGGIAVAFLAILAFLILGPMYIGWLQHRHYVHLARKVNREALERRLARPDYKGWPLPMGKRGELVITDKQMVSLDAVSESELRRAYEDRVRDLGASIELWSIQDFSANRLLIRWKPTKSKPKAHY
jgi:hypothetical protein